MFGISKKKLEKKLQTMTPEEAYTEGSVLATKEKYDDAILYYEYAAENGHAAAQMALSDCFYYGRGCDANESSALSWCEKSAEQGHLRAQQMCASMYENGTGCEADTEKALYWYKQCLQGTDGPEAEPLRRAISRLTPATEEPVATPNTTQATAPGATLLEKAAACRQTNPEEALRLYEQVAESGHAGAQYQCGYMYFHGEGCECDFEKAYHWFRQPADLGNPQAQFYYGALCFCGMGCEKDMEQARYWLNKSAVQGCEEALALLEEISNNKSV